MWHRFHKPTNLPFHHITAAVTKMNIAIPDIAGVGEFDKFLEEELVELLKCSLPHKRHAKFDLEGSVPLCNTRAILTTRCEALECNEPVKDIDKNCPLRKETVARQSSIKRARKLMHLV